MELRDRIKKIRKNDRYDMTQAEFSLALGLAPTSAASWEKKVNPQVPTESMRLLICEKFGIDREWLETGKGEMFADNTAVTQRATHDSPAMQALISAYNQLDENGKQVFEEYARNFVAAYHAARQAQEDEAFNRARSDAQASSESEQTAL